MFADRHPYAGGPDHYAAYLENTDGFEVELVAGAAWEPEGRQTAEGLPPRAAGHTATRRRLRAAHDLKAADDDADLGRLG
jgi:hypothetical protein